MEDFVKAVDSIYKMMDRTAEMIYEGDVKDYFVEHYGYEENDYVVFLLLEYMKDNYFN